jgi:hypothetical protein
MQNCLPRVCRLGLDGVVAERLDGRHRPGDHGWVKVGGSPRELSLHRNEGSALVPARAPQETGRRRGSPPSIDLRSRPLITRLVVVGLRSRDSGGASSAELSALSIAGRAWTASSTRPSASQRQHSKSLHSPHGRALGPQRDRWRVDAENRGLVELELAVRQVVVNVPIRGLGRFSKARLLRKRTDCSSAKRQNRSLVSHTSTTSPSLTPRGDIRRTVTARDQSCRMARWVESG